MMDISWNILAVALIVLWIAEIILGAFQIGMEKSEKTWTMGEYVGNSIKGVITIYIFGVALGWW